MLQYLNGHHAFKTPKEVFTGGSALSSAPSSVLQFEDGVKCDYESPLMRARVCEMALAIHEHVKSMDFSDKVSIALALLHICNMIPVCFKHE